MTSVHLRIRRAALIRRRGRQQVDTRSVRNAVDSNAHGGLAEPKALTPLGRRAVAATAVPREREVTESRPSGTHGSPCELITVPAMADDPQYEDKSVQA